MKEICHPECEKYANIECYRCGDTVLEQQEEHLMPKDHKFYDPDDECLENIWDRGCHTNAGNWICHSECRE